MNVVWIALAFIVDAAGPHAVAGDAPFRSEAECMEQVRIAVTQLIKDPDVMMLGAGCVALNPTVTPAGEAVLKSSKKPTSTPREYTRPEYEGGVIKGETFL
jgi:hypothetical protein